jgi:hypothetical protein
LICFRVVSSEEWAAREAAGEPPRGAIPDVIPDV